LNKIQKSPRIFFGWWTVFACGIVGFLGVGFGGTAFSILFKPIAADLHLDRAVTSIASGLQSAMGGIIGILGGRASDKYGPRRVMLFGIIILALSCIAMYFINSLWSFLLVWGIAVGAGCQLGATIITDRAIVNWFIKKSGIAINTKFAIQSLAGLLLLPVIALLVANQGWRNTCVVAGIVIAVICIPLIWFFVKPHRPEYYGLKPDGLTDVTSVKRPLNKKTGDADGTDATDLTLRQTMKTSVYWLLISIGYISGFTMPMMSAHFVPFLTDRGISPIQAASMMGLLSTIGIPARLATGFIIDRLKTERLRFIMAAGIFMQAAGIIIFLAVKSMSTIYIWIIFYSIGSAISGSVSLPLQARYFGRKAFGIITGVSSAIQLPIGLSAPVIIGWIFDTTGNYMNVISMIAVLLVISGIMACFIRRPKSTVLVPDTFKLVG